MIKATTPIYAVIGDPIAHSLSPLMQNWFIQQFGLDAVYVAFHVRAAQLKMSIEGMRALGIQGINVTVPHKEAVTAWVDELAPEVKLLGAANTLKNIDGKISAFVTDPYGFIESLAENAARFNSADVLMFGAGGAARSVCYALSHLSVNRIILHDIDEQKTDSLIRLCRTNLGLSKTIALKSMAESMNDILAATPIVINATAVGMHPLENRSVLENVDTIHRGHFFYDLIYNPAKTRFLRMAEQAGASVQNGLDMLIFQGLQSMRIWTGEELKLAGASLQELRALLTHYLGIHE